MPLARCNIRDVIFFIYCMFKPQGPHPVYPSPGDDILMRYKGVRCQWYILPVALWYKYFRLTQTVSFSLSVSEISVFLLIFSSVLSVFTLHPQ